MCSELVSGVAEQKQIRISLKVMLMDLYLLQCTFHHTLCTALDSAVFKSVDFVLLVDQCTNDDDLDTCFLAKCIMAVVISRLDSDEGEDEDCCWSGIIQCGLNWSESEFSGQHSCRRGGGGGQQRLVHVG